LKKLQEILETDMRMNNMKICVDLKTGTLANFRITNAKQFGTGVLKAGTLPVL